ncbi:MAG: histone deacetylase [Spirochaetes bacterium]|nr:MAG: histone deacetylase [Spirochaetota bacterium]
MQQKTGILRDKAYLDHNPGIMHPECPDRLKVIYELLDSPENKDKYFSIPVREASEEELLYIHVKDYIELVKSTEGKPYGYLDPDTRTSPGSYSAALKAVGGLCNAVNFVASGKLDNAFALVRPPGHHAEKDKGRGFCIFNNIAIAAKYAQMELGLGKILIVDWDLHHGNGTQHAFEDDPSVLYFSTHQFPYYPGTGSFRETGRGEGAGYTVNIPLSTGYGDREYIAIYEKILKPIALKFSPDIVLVSAGFDIYQFDPLGGMLVTPAGFAGLTNIVKDIAGSSCKGRLVLTLEGGYNLQGLYNSVSAVLKVLTSGEGPNNTEEYQYTSGRDDAELNEIIDIVIKKYSRWWDF